MIALINGKLYTITDGIIERGTVLLEGNKIAAVGADVQVPADAQIIDVEGRIITPGFIDAHTHIGIDEEIHQPIGDDCNEMTEPNTAELRAMDAINYRDLSFQDAVKAGITTVMITPGSANVFGGLITVMKTYGKTYKDMLIDGEAGLKMAFGENPKRVYGEKDKTPSTRMATMAIARQGFYEAKEYLKKSEEDREFSLQTEHIAKALDGGIPVRAHAHRADDIMTAIRLRDEFNLNLVVEHCTDGHLIVDELKEAGVAVTVGPSLSNRAKVEMENVTFRTPGVLASAGIDVAIITDAPCTPIQYLPICAGMAMREGMTEEDAFKALTITPAKILNVDDRLGSLTAGKDADIVVWENYPLEIMGRANMVFVNGTQVV
ncbi:MAG: amidohydrolase [Peptococcaceae bacterium]|nr:amidohydrolase [Peptococcaceae bacterium]